MLGFIVADTTVVVDNQILHKPVDFADNVRMVGFLANRTHEVMTRFCVERQDGVAHTETVTTQVSVRSLSGPEIEGYATSGEGADKAGGYAIQGLGSFAVTGIQGSYTNVVGLPASELVSALLALGLLPSFPLPAIR